MDKLFQKSYFASLFLAGLPSIYFLIPIINSPNIAKVIWFFLFLALLIKIFKENVRLTIDNKLLLFFLLFFISQSLSIIYATNIIAFINSYKDFVLASLLFIVSLFILKTKQDFYNIFKIFIITGIINLTLQMLIFLSPQFFENTAEFYLHPTYLEIITVNIDRGRIFLTSYNEIFIPLIFYYLIVGIKGKKLLFGIFLSVLIFFISLVSGFRTNLIMYFISLVGSLILFDTHLKRVLIFVLIFLIPIYIMSSLSRSLQINTSIDRLLQNESNIIDVTTGRANYWSKAYEIGSSSPLFGAGLGNYYDHIDSTWKYNQTFNKSADIQNKFALQDPHNIFMRIFAETGFLGLLTFTVLVVYFVKNDINIWRSKSKQYKSYVLSFWILFIFSLLNPSTSATYQAFFWTMRAIIHNKII